VLNQNRRSSAASTCSPMVCAVDCGAMRVGYNRQHGSVPRSSRLLGNPSDATSKDLAKAMRPSVPWIGGRLCLALSLSMQFA
jgi:hypothetical protein